MSICIIVLFGIIVITMLKVMENTSGKRINIKWWKYDCRLLYFLKTIQLFYGGVFFYNDGTAMGVGGIYYSTLNITRSVFYKNNAVLGKDIFHRGGNLVVSDCWWGSNRDQMMRIFIMLQGLLKLKIGPY